MSGNGDFSPAARRAMDARARSLARLIVTASAEAADVFIRFAAGEGQWAVDAREVAQIAPAGDFQRIPGSAGFFVGPWRGHLVVAIDVPAFLGLPNAPDSGVRHIIVLTGGRTAVFADGAPVLEDVPASSLRAGRGTFTLSALSDGTPVLDADALRAAARPTREETR
jgi:chemotaxis signal transduction protein